MNHLEQYIEDILKIPIHLRPVPAAELKALSIYVRNAYKLSEARILNQDIVFIQPNHPKEIKILQLQKHLTILRQALSRNGVLVLDELPAYQKQRLIEKGINFIVPGQQLFLPDLLIDLKEEPKIKTAGQQGRALIPAAQFVLLYHLLHRDDLTSIDKFPLQEVAFMTGYSGTIMTRVVENLLYHELIRIEGTKEKTIHFLLPRRDLWENAVGDKKLTSPVTKRVFIDALPTTNLLKANASALPEYTNMNPANQEYYAIHRTAFYTLTRAGKLKNSNPQEGKFCIEVWKYNPIQLATPNQINKGVVDPLSLYLSMQDIEDERIEMELKLMINNLPW